MYHLAQFNFGKLAFPIDSPNLKGFVDNLERINAIAEQSPGFVWRRPSYGLDDEAIQQFGREFIVNLSVWENVDSLHQYVYHSAHLELLRRKTEWFERIPEAHLVLWWVPVGHIPNLVEARSRLESLRENGPAETAFHFKSIFSPPMSA